MGVRNVHVSVDSKLVANQVLGTYVAKEENMVKYLEKAKNLINGFANFSISQVPRSKNKKADALSKIVSTSFAHLSKQVLVKVLKEKSIQEEEVKGGKQTPYQGKTVRIVGRGSLQAVIPKAVAKVCWTNSSELCERAAIREANAKLKMTKYYNARVRCVTFRPGDFVYRSNKVSHAMDGGKLSQKWKGPYEVTEALEDGAYKLRSIDGVVLPRTWNIANLKKCYL
ncbi:reverse transcriptase domain-containing protein [Tanacetum coccineum]